MKPWRRNIPRAHKRELLTRIPQSKLMHRFEFTAPLQTGNVDLDAHCRTLFALANAVVYSENLERSPDQFRHAVRSLVAYLDCRLRSEEQVMSRTGYPSRLFHTAFHEHIRYQAGEIAARAERQGDREETKDAIYLMIEDWLVYHVLTADRELARFLGEARPMGSIARLPSIRALKPEGSLPSDVDEQSVEVIAGLDRLEPAP